MCSSLGCKVCHCKVGQDWHLFPWDTHGIIIWHVTFDWDGLLGQWDHIFWQAIQLHSVWWIYELHKQGIQSKLVSSDVVCLPAYHCCLIVLDHNWHSKQSDNFPGWYSVVKLSKLFLQAHSNVVIWSEGIHQSCLWLFISRCICRTITWMPLVLWVEVDEQSAHAWDKLLGSKFIDLVPVCIQCCDDADITILKEECLIYKIWPGDLTHYVVISSFLVQSSQNSCTLSLATILATVVVVTIVT